MDKLSAVIVDDEPLALNFLRGILSKFPSIDIVAECKNGREAVAARHLLGRALGHYQAVPRGLRVSRRD